MFEPGYYKTNSRAVRLREMVRWYGRARGLWSWLRTRFMPMSRHGRWMPGLWAENECKPDDLSEDFWQATKPYRADLEKLGFVQCRIGRATKKSDKISDPAVLDEGSIFYLDPTRCYLGQLIYSRHVNLSKGKIFNNIVLAFTAVFERGNFSCTNNRLSFDSANPGEVIRMNSYDVNQIYNRFREGLDRRREAPRPFADIESLQQWFDARQIRNFEDHVRRRLFIRMTESEVAALWAERQRYPAGRPPPVPRRRFRLNLVTTTFVVLGVISTILQLHRHRIDSSINIDRNSMTENTIQYHGQQFKLSRSYQEYDDYKDDPNNLDTNELPRIERTMESVKVPASFNDRRAFIDFMFDLEFPGYGLGFLGASSTTDDGSTIEAALAEIPQVGKERVVVARKVSGGSWTLLDDFIYNGSDTNDVGKVRLEHHQLKYFDAGGHLFRKKGI